MLNTPHNPRALSEWMTTNGDQVVQCFKAVPETRYNRAPAPGVWSPAQQLDHLIRSARPVARALQLPRLPIRLLFGRPADAAETYAGLRTRYRGSLQAGAGATGRFVPELPPPAMDPARLQSEQLDRWQSTMLDLTTHLARWSERDLDRLALPHPILGSLSVRQMVYFTHFHNLHHVADVQGLFAYDHQP